MMGSKGIMAQERKAFLIGMTRVVAKCCLLPFFKIEATGQERLPNKGAFILLPKHQRWEDIPILALATPSPLYYVAKYELFKDPLSRWFMTSLGGIPLNRRRPLETRRSLKNMVGFIEEGEGLVIFPEGTYYLNRMGPGYVGLIRMIHSRTHLPYIPVGIRYGRKGARTSARVAFGHPIHADQATAPEELLDRIMKDIASLSGF